MEKEISIPNENDLAKNIAESSLNRKQNESKYPLNVFISYKIDQFSDAIDGIVAKIVANYDAKLSIYASKANKLGSPWREEIHKELKKADILILLYLDRDEKYDFCFYETGFLCGAAQDRKIKIITVTNEGVEIPHPVSGWDGMAFNKIGVKKLLQAIYNNQDKPIWSPTLDINILNDRESELERKAEFILENLRPVVRKSISPRIWITVTQSQMEKINKGEIPSDIKIRGQSQAFNDFNLDFEKDITLDQFIEKLARGNQTVKIEFAMRNFIPHLLETLINIREEFFNVNPPPPIRLKGNNAKVFVPTYMLKKIDYKTEKPYEYRFEFLVHENSTAFNIDQTGTLDRIHNLYMTTFHFKWRVLDRWLYQLNVLLDGKRTDEQEIFKNIQELKLDICRSFLDSHNRKFSYPSDIRVIFQNEDDVNYINKIIGRNGEWYDLYERLEKSIDSVDIENILEILKMMNEINGVFITITTKRLYEAVQGI